MFAALSQRKIDHRTAAITSTVTTSKIGVSNMALSWQKRRAGPKLRHSGPGDSVNAASLLRRTLKQAARPNSSLV
jgi:hypothetical protein